MRRNVWSLPLFYCLPVHALWRTHIASSRDRADGFLPSYKRPRHLQRPRDRLNFVLVDDQVGGCPRHLSVWDLLQEKISSLAEMTTMQTPQGRVIGHVPRPPRHQGGRRSRRATLCPAAPAQRHVGGVAGAPSSSNGAEKVQVGAHTRMLIPLLFDLLPRFFITHWFEVYRPIHIPFTSQPVTPLIHITHSLVSINPNR